MRALASRSTPLQCHRPLSLKLLSAPFAARQHFGMASLGLRETTLGSRDFLLHLHCGAADLVVDPLQDLGQ